jgi:SAM-dependent methyltransferase
VIVDIGCGAGQTVLQLAQRVGPGGQVIGVDIAPLLLTLACQRAEGLSQVSFIECDALRLDLPKESVDGFFSRFGVMAFADPIAAFSNFHRIMRPSGRLAFVCWRSLIENELDLSGGGARSHARPDALQLREAGLLARNLTDGRISANQHQGTRRGSFQRRFGRDGYGAPEGRASR